MLQVFVSSSEGRGVEKQPRIYFDLFPITPFSELLKDSSIWFVHFSISVIWKLAVTTLAVLPQWI